MIRTPRESVRQLNALRKVSGRPQTAKMCAESAVQRSKFCYPPRRGKTVLSGFWIILTAAMATATSGPQVAVATPQAKAAAPSTAGARLEHAASAIDDGRFDDALRFVSDAQTGGLLVKGDADWAVYLKARALVGLGRADGAEATARERYRDNANGYTWASLVAILAASGRYEQAASEIMELKEESLIFANRLKPNLIDGVVEALGGDAKTSALRDRLIVRLVEGRYTGPSAQRVPDLLRLRYINLLLRQRRVEDAARQTEGLESPAILSWLLTDKAFEPLWEHATLRALWAPGALIARVERGVQARLEAQTLTSSDWLDLMRALRTIGKADEAVRLGLHALEQARKENRAAGPAVRLEIASAYVDLGQAWAARRTARELLREEKTAPASLRVQIAEIMEASGDDDGALLLLGSLGPAGDAPLALKATACAAHDLDRSTKRDEALAKLEAMSEAAPAAVLDAYVCTGQKDKAAVVLAAMLNRSDMRSAAILAAQLYADPLAPATDQSDMRYRMTALVASAAVQEAIKPYARTMALPFMMANARSN
jgi:tetratricopeptide (TPR) repeat protein